MDQVDSLNEMALQSTPMANGGVSNVANASQVIAVAADLPSFQYFISEQAKSILALQELQNEVGALLEFRDLVMEAFPQLGQKVQNMQAQNAISPSCKWEPGIRVKRKLGQQPRSDADLLVASLVPRYRSNSQGKASRSGDISGSATSSSAIQDSGFCAESSKDHLSALSSRSKSRDTADELFSLLDSIHNKGARLKLEVEYLRSRLNRRDGGCASLADATPKQRWRRRPPRPRCKSLDDLVVVANGSPSFTFEYAMKTALLETELSTLKEERDVLLKQLDEVKSEHRSNQAQTNRLLTELETMSAEKRELEERLQLAVHSENDVNGRINDLHANFLMRNRWRNAQTPFAKCQLLKLEQVFKGTTHRSDADDDVSTHNNSGHVRPGAAVVVDDPDSNAARAMRPLVALATFNDDYSRPEYEQAPLGDKVERPVNPVTKELMNNATSYQAEGGLKAEMPDVTATTPTTTTTFTATSTSVITFASTKEFGDAVHKLSGAGASLGRTDMLMGFVSGQPSSFDSAISKHDGGGGGGGGGDGGVTLSKEKVLSILNEYDPKTLHCFLLTLFYQLEVLKVHVQRVSKSRANLFKQLNKYKFENEDLKLELKKKEIELEGTKAQKRVLQQKRGCDVKLSYSTSDLMTTSLAAKSCTSQDPRADPSSSSSSSPAYACSVSDSALTLTNYRTSSDYSPPSGRCGGGGGGSGGGGARALGTGVKCADIARECGDKAIKSAGGGGASRRSFSKIPLKTYSSRLPTKLNSCGVKKTLTSFKEYSAPGPPHSSCISSTSSSSLNHK